MKQCLLIITLVFIALSAGASELDDYQGIKIEASTSDAEQGVKISGALSVFVNCGSQYAIWHQFPEIISYTLKDLDSGHVYESNYAELSISWGGDTVHEMYAKEPCNKIVSKEFSVLLTGIFLNQPPENEIFNFELKASYMGFSSNTVVIKNTPLILNSTTVGFSR